ncbi:acetyltransferase [Bacillaceae bacterium JMAK1]|nr:acetyltransferase [Bacillaceae bacterium JMAK1]
MIQVQKATKQHVTGIISVCTRGYWSTYKELASAKYIQRICDEFYHEARVSREVTETSKHWGGYFVALENGTVVGAGGGGMIAEQSAELFVLYLDPDRRNEGIGSRLLAEITKQQVTLGATEQWVSVQQHNEKGIPFYKAKGFIYQTKQKGYRTTENEQYVSLRYKRNI